jgi:hypothetical protein
MSINQETWRSRLLLNNVAEKKNRQGALLRAAMMRDNGTTNGFGDEKFSAPATVSFHINALGSLDNVLRFSSGDYSSVQAGHNISEGIYSPAKQSGSLNLSNNVLGRAINLLADALS